MEFLTQFEQGFADLEAAFDRPAIAVQTHDFRVGQIELIRLMTRLLRILKLSVVMSSE